MKTLTVEDIDKLKIMGYITQVIPSSIILANLDTVTALKLKRLLTQTDPDSDIENVISGGGHDYSKDYLTFRIIQGGNLCWGSGVSGVSAEGRTIEYSVNGGDWTEITSYPQSIIPVNDGDIVRFKGNNADGFGVWDYDTLMRRVYIGQAGGWFFGYDPETGDTATNAIFSIEGNIMSIVDSQNFATMEELSTSYMFAEFFGGGLGECITSASNLILPATTLANSCYGYMFADCSSLTTAPALPATTLAEGCYKEMFYGCTSLTTAPELPAAILVDSCYDSIFYHCTSLNHIKCLATDISATNCTRAWASGVSATGTFIGVEGNPAGWWRNDRGVPSGWECNFAPFEESMG